MRSAQKLIAYPFTVSSACSLSARDSSGEQFKIHPRASMNSCRFGFSMIRPFQRSLTTSLVPGASTVTTGTPAAMASRSTTPCVSLNDVKAKTSMARYASARSSLYKNPVR
ncbi:MAG TPA: hypothetical protein DE315_02600 [Candidatus Omnitrophica bacterium]|nr:hypothetical protein [Candidatus Omnitrophota bacterium]